MKPTFTYPNIENVLKHLFYSSKRDVLLCMIITDETIDAEPEANGR